MYIGKDKLDKTGSTPKVLSTPISYTDPTLSGIMPLCKYTPSPLSKGLVHLTSSLCSVIKWSIAPTLGHLPKTKKTKKGKKISLVNKGKTCYSKRSAA